MKFFNFFKRKKKSNELIDPINSINPIDAIDHSQESISTELKPSLTSSTGESPSPSSQTFAELTPANAVTQATSVTAVEPSTSAYASEQTPLDTSKKKAIAIIAYNNLEYFSKVFHSVLKQTINNQPFSELFDLYVFQDGLQTRHNNTLEAYQAIATLALEHLPVDRFIRQERNIGTGLHFAYIESYIFEQKGYDFSFFLEHDFELGENYFQTMELLYSRFVNDPRISCISGHSSFYKESQEEQAKTVDDYSAMTHDWGAGVFKRTWQKRLPAMKSYYQLLEGAPFEQRNNLLIQDWMSFMGFKKGSTSQDTIKACVDAGLNLLRITTRVNLGTYIGREGMHWNSTIYEDQGYHQTVIFEGEYKQARELSEQEFNTFMGFQKEAYLERPKEFSHTEFEKRLLSGDTQIVFTKNATSALATADDVVAAYKFFLGRMPESHQVVQARVGLDMKRLLIDFMLSNEFLNREELWPIVVESHKRIVGLYQARYPAAPKENATVNGTVDGTVNGTADSKIPNNTQ